MLRVERKVRECLRFGVPYVWIIDPETLESRVYTPSGDYEPPDGTLRTQNPEIVVPLFEVFED